MHHLIQANTLGGNFYCLLITISGSTTHQCVSCVALSPLCLEACLTVAVKTELDPAGLSIPVALRKQPQGSSK